MWIAGRLPRQRGPALRAALLNAVERSDPVLSAWLHAPVGVSARYRPYALTLLEDADDGGAGFSVHVLAADGGVMRAESVAAAIQHALTDLDGSDPERVFRVLHATYRVADVEASFEPYSRMVGASPSWEWTLRFLSPTTKRADNRRTGRLNLPLPVPETVFGSLLERWRYHSGLALTALSESVLAVGLEVVAARLETRKHLCKEPGTYLTGCQGSVTYRAVGSLRSDPDASAAVSTLACFATYAGVGDETPVGMGWVELGAPST